MLVQRPQAELAAALLTTTTIWAAAQASGARSDIDEGLHGGAASILPLEGKTAFLGPMH
jgi:hypothetical protein